MLKPDYLILFPVFPCLLVLSHDLLSQSPQLLTYKRCKTQVDCVGDPLSSCDQISMQCICSPTSSNISTLLIVNQTLIQCVVGIPCKPEPVTQTQVIDYVTLRMQEGNASKRVTTGCVFHQECALSDPKSVCTNRTCQCTSGLIWHMGNCQVNGTDSVIDTSNPTVLPVLCVLCVMFIGMCVALNMFSRARFSNTPGVFNNPRAARILKDVQVAHSTQRNKSKRRFSSRPSIIPEPMMEQLQSSPGPHRPSLAPEQA